MSNVLRAFHAHSPTLGERVYIDPASVVIGNVTLGDDCSVWPMSVIRGDMHRITIGARTSVQARPSFCFIPPESRPARRPMNASRPLMRIRRA